MNVSVHICRILPFFFYAQLDDPLPLLLFPRVEQVLDGERRHLPPRRQDGCRRHRRHSGRRTVRREQRHCGRKPRRTTGRLGDEGLDRGERRDGRGHRVGVRVRSAVRFSISSRSSRQQRNVNFLPAVEPHDVDLFIHLEGVELHVALPARLLSVVVFAKRVKIHIDPFRLDDGERIILDKSYLCKINNLFTCSFFCCFSNCFNNFFSRLSRSFLSSSSGEMGSPEQVCGCALCAGRPGPFFVFSFLRNLARRFWNHTYQNEFYLLSRIKRIPGATRSTTSRGPIKNVFGRTFD